MLEQPDHNINEKFLVHYEFLKEIGIWDHLSELETDNHNLEKFFSEALELFNTYSVQGLIDFVISCFLDKFVPEHLLFVVEDPGTGNPETHYFRRLKPAELRDDLAWYPKLKESFAGNSAPIRMGAPENRISAKAAEALEEYEADILLPMKGIGGVYGLIVFGRKVVRREYSDRELAYINRLMQFFSVGLQNALHHHSSITDVKTGLFNHSYFMKRLEEEVLRSHRNKTDTALIVVDIDHFKKFNDTYGHLAGDAVLAEVARAMKSLLRAEDVLARFGGEEFTLLLPHSSPAALGEIAERLRKTVEDTKTVYENHRLKVTISLGCGYSSPAARLSPMKLLAQADAALYQSKAGGRNRVTVFENPVNSESDRIPRGG